MKKHMSKDEIPIIKSMLEASLKQKEVSLYYGYSQLQSFRRALKELGYELVFTIVERKC